MAVPRLFLPTELHSWLPFGYFSAINDPKSDKLYNGMRSFPCCLKCSNPQNECRSKKFPCLTDHHNEIIMATKQNLTILKAVKAQFFKFTTAHPGTWVGEGCYIILGTMLQGCNEKLKTALPRQESTVYISSA